MTASNHITGGTVFTGIFASLWDVNIFSDINLLIVCWFASLLPDVDHTKSPVGRLFLPISRYINRKFGHRTITHSIIFILSLWLIARLFLPSPFPLVFLLALISHLIFDMMTVQGVPLLYPFRKNPCVIPGNPEARIRSGNVRAELTAFVLFIICGSFCYPLMANGFWLTFNNALGSKKQLISEFRKSDNILWVNYEFRRDFEDFKGAGYCVQAKTAKVVFLDTAKGFVTMTSEDIGRSFTMAKSKYTSLNELSVKLKFKDITMAQIDSMIKNRPIIKGKILANNVATFIVDGEEKKTNYLKLNYVNDYRSLDEISGHKSIKIKQIKISHLKENYNHELKKYRQDLKEIQGLKRAYSTSSDIKKSEINKKLQAIDPVPPDERSYLHAIEILQAEIKSLEKEDLRVSGSITVVQL